MEEDSQTSRRTNQDRQNESTNDLSSTGADDTTDTDDDDDTIVERPGVRYPLRRNKSERNRIKLEHELYRHVWQGNYSAPVDSILLQDGAKVLDIGCGTGIWIEDMFSKFPSAQFTGIDVFPVSFRTKSPNLTFIEHNVIDGLPFEDNHFDYVHCRHCLFAFSPDEWVEIVIPEIIRVTKPLGFIEHCEIDGNFINEGPLLKKLTNAVRELITNRGIDCAMGENLDQALIQTKALYKVHHQHKYSPVGGDSWGGDYGQKAFDSFSRIVLAFQHDVSAMIDVAISDFNSFTSKCAEEAKSHRTYFKSHRIFAQKRSTDS